MTVSVSAGVSETIFLPRLPRLGLSSTDSVITGISSVFALRPLRLGVVSLVSSIGAGAGEIV